MGRRVFGLLYWKYLTDDVGQRTAQMAIGLTNAIFAVKKVIRRETAEREQIDESDLQTVETTIEEGRIT